MEPHIKKTIDSYDKTVKGYIERTDPLYREERVKLFLDLIDQNSDGKEILDMGCAQGRDAEKLVEKGYNVTGIDLSENFIELARQRVPKAEFKLMDMRKLEFNDKKFDGVWASASFVHIPKQDLLKTLSEVKRILKNTGIFYISVKLGEGDGIKEDPRHENVEKYWVFFMEEQIKEYLNKAGFEIVDTTSNDSNNKHVDYTWLNLYCKKKN